MTRKIANRHPIKLGDKLYAVDSMEDFPYYKIDKEESIITGLRLNSEDGHIEIEVNGADIGLADYMLNEPPANGLGIHYTTEQLRNEALKAFYKELVKDLKKQITKFECLIKKLHD